MIPCPKCGADNMIGAIFCRSCSAKLELDDIKPETFEEKEKSPAAKAGLIIQRLISLAIFLVVAGAVVAIFLPGEGRVTDEFEEKAVKKLDREYKFVLKPTRKKHSYTFSSAQATLLVNHALNLKSMSDYDEEEIGGDASGPFGLTPNHMSIAFLANNQVRLVLRSLMMNKVPMSSTIVVRLEETEDAGIACTIVSAAAGRLPCPGPMQAPIVGRFQALFGISDDLSQMQKRAEKLEISPDEVNFSMKRR